MSVAGRMMGLFRWRRGMARRLAYIIGAVVAGVGALMLPAAATSALYREWHETIWILAAAGITMVAGMIGWRWIGRQGELNTKEAFAAAGLSYFVITVFGALPYLLTGSIIDPTDAMFETAAGFTTTGATVLTDPALLSHGMLIWRAMTQWMGGMGIIVLSIAILPLLGVGGVQLARAEAPGPEPSRLTPRFRDTAKRLWLLYLALTAGGMLLLALGDMGLFQAIAHGFTTVASGGFGTESDSLMGFSAYTQWVVIVLMFLTGVSYALHYRALREPREYLRSAEFVRVTPSAAACSLLSLWSPRPGSSPRIGPGGSSGCRSWWLASCSSERWPVPLPVVSRPTGSACWPGRPVMT